MKFPEEYRVTSSSLKSLKISFNGPIRPNASYRTNGRCILDTLWKIGGSWFCIGSVGPGRAACNQNMQFNTKGEPAKMTEWKLLNRVTQNTIHVKKRDVKESKKELHAHNIDEARKRV